MRMSSLKTRILLLVFVLALGLGAVLNGLSVGAGGPELQLPATVLVVSVVYCSILFWFGLQVSRYSQREKRQDARAMNPLTAARTVVWAQTAAYVGAMFAGWHVALLFYQIGLLSLRSTWTPVGGAIIGVISGVLMLAIGMIVENMCKIPPSDSDDEQGSRASGNEQERRGYAQWAEDDKKF